MEKIKAVNLGGWFVLERWMTPALFSDSGSEMRCETSFVKHHPNPKVALEQHWQTWITKADFTWISEHGINVVRIPVPWWIFPELDNSNIPYHSPLRYLDQAMEWAKETSLSVMIDLHTAPGSQNGFDNGGIDGVLTWHHDPKNIEKTVEVLKALASRYGLHPALHSIQALNEPHWTIDLSILQSFYRQVYQTIRPILPKHVAIVFHDGFRLKEWVDFFQTEAMENVILDTHLYQCFDDKFRHMDAQTFLAYPEENLKAMKLYENIVPVIVGEWSLGAGKIDYPLGREAFEKTYAEAQFRAYSQVAGWVFWSYKIADYNSGWNFRSLVERGLIQLEA